MLPKIVARINIPKLDRKLNIENFFSLDTNHLPLLKFKINLLLCCCTMRVFWLTENKPIDLVLAKSFFLYDVTIEACLKSL